MISKFQETHFIINHQREQNWKVPHYFFKENWNDNRRITEKQWVEEYP